MGGCAQCVGVLQDGCAVGGCAQWAGVHPFGGCAQCVGVHNGRVCSVWVCTVCGCAQWEGVQCVGVHSVCVCECETFAPFWYQGDSGLIE